MRAIAGAFGLNNRDVNLASSRPFAGTTVGACKEGPFARALRNNARAADP